MAQHRDALIAQQLVEQLPDVVHAAAEALASSNLTVLNGAEGLNQMFGGLLTTGLNMLNRVQSGLPESNGQLSAGEPATAGAANGDAGSAADAAAAPQGTRRSPRPSRRP